MARTLPIRTSLDESEGIRRGRHPSLLAPHGLDEEKSLKVSGRHINK